MSPEIPHHPQPDEGVLTPPLEAGAEPLTEEAVSSPEITPQQEGTVALSGLARLGQRWSARRGEALDKKLENLEDNEDFTYYLERSARATTEGGRGPEEIDHKKLSGRQRHQELKLQKKKEKYYRRVADAKFEAMVSAGYGHFQLGKTRAKRMELKDKARKAFSKGEISAAELSKKLWDADHHFVYSHHHPAAEKAEKAKDKVVEYADKLDEKAVKKTDKHSGKIEAKHRYTAVANPAVWQAVQAEGEAEGLDRYIGLSWFDGSRDWEIIYQDENGKYVVDSYDNGDYRTERFTPDELEHYLSQLNEANELHYAGSGYGEEDGYVDEDVYEEGNDAVIHEFGSGVSPDHKIQWAPLPDGGYFVTFYTDGGNIERGGYYSTDEMSALLKSYRIDDEDD